MSKLYVDEIRPKTSGNQVLFPEKPAMRIGITSAISVTSTGLTLVEFNETTTDNCFIQGFTLSNGVITVPVAGMYYFGGSVEVDNLNTGYCELKFFKNNSESGNNFGYAIDGSPATNYQSLTFGTVFKLDAGDNVRMSINTNADSAYIIQIYGTELHGFLIG